MADQFTTQVTDIRQRLGAVEGEGVDGTETISRIQKSYGKVGIRLTVRAYTHRYDYASTTNYASATKYI
jgi:hypothetical protein